MQMALAALGLPAETSDPNNKIYEGDDFRAIPTEQDGCRIVSWPSPC